jgi:hypothetical protein
MFIHGRGKQETHTKNRLFLFDNNVHTCMVVASKKHIIIKKYRLLTLTITFIRGCG